MFRFRGQQKGNDEWIEGWYIQTRAHVLDDNDLDDYPVNHLIVDEFMNEYDVYPHTLSISTGKPDSTEQEIFASFEIDGVMTTGGDVVNVPRWKHLGDMPVTYSAIWRKFIVGYFELSSADSNEITIIGKQRRIYNHA